MSAPSDFDAGLREKSEAVSADLSSESEMLLVAFGGLAGGMLANFPTSCERR